MTQQSTERNEKQQILGASAIMAAGTVVSRLSGYVRSILLAAALGNLLRADVFNIANTIPNMLYILLAGGAINAVLVPQLVRAMKNDPDGGDAYTNRIITLAGLFLGALTVLLVALAPQVIDLVINENWSADARQSAIDVARFCLPQVFFYGMFVLVGQILNARGRFGPMMWAPIANNLIAIGVLATYWVVFGFADADEVNRGLDAGQAELLGIGSTLGIAAQFLILVPFLRAVGFRFRPRFDFRGAGLGHTLRLGGWTLLFVLANQIAYLVVVRLASGGTAGQGVEGTGYSIYTSAFLIVMVPHAIVTVSLATAILPTLSRRAAERDRAGLGRTLSETMRTALAVVLPFAALLPLVAPDIARVISYGAASDTFENYIPSLMLFGPGLVFFTVHYLMLRGFYALEQNRTVFFIQCFVAATNIVVALVLVRASDAAGTAPSLVLAYSAAYFVGSVLSFLVLRHRLGGLQTPTLLRYLVRLGLTLALAIGLAGLVAWLMRDIGADTSYLLALLRGAVVSGVAGVSYLALAHVFRIREVTEVLDTLTRRFRRPRKH